MSVNFSSKIFIGVRFKGKLKAELNLSSSWKSQLQISISPLKLITYEQIPYIALELPPICSIVDIGKFSDQLKSQLQLYVAKTTLDSQSIFIFEQKFIG